MAFVRYDMVRYRWYHFLVEFDVYNDVQVRNESSQTRKVLFRSPGLQLARADYFLGLFASYDLPSQREITITITIMILYLTWDLRLA